MRSGALQIQHMEIHKININQALDLTKFLNPLQWQREIKVNSEIKIINENRRITTIINSKAQILQSLNKI